MSRRGPWRITFDTNPDDCNLRCTMCEEHSVHLNQRRFEREGRRRRMNVSVIRRVVEECKDAGLREIIPSTMGEPLLYKDFEEILELCQEAGVKLNLTTNGTFPRLGATEWARRIVPVASDVKISWNGMSAATQEAVMIGSRLEKQVRNLRKFVRVRDEARRAGEPACTLTLQTTFMESNYDELPDLVRFAFAEGVDRVKGHHLWVHLPVMADQDMRRSPGAIARWNEVARECREIASRRRPEGSRVILAHFEPIEPTDPTAPAGPCPFLGEEAWVNWEGRFDPCCAPDYLRRGLGRFGNVEDEGLMSIWRGEAYRRLQAGYEDHEVCKTCVMRLN